MNVTFSGKVWQYEGAGGWHFVTVPSEIGREIRTLQPKGLKGFGSVSVQATCAGQSWKTSVFPDTKSGSYLLPLKAGVRKALGVVAGQELEITLELD